MGRCRYCGQSAGLFKTVHSECRDQFQKTDANTEEILFELDDRTGKINEVSRKEFDNAIKKGGHAVWASVGIGGGIESKNSKEPRLIDFSEKPFEQLYGLSEQARRSLIELTKKAISADEPLEDLAIEVENLLSEHQYEWPAFDKWVLFFKQQNKWPEMWRLPLRQNKTELVDSTKSERDQYWLRKEAVRSKIFLLTHTITSELYRYERYRSLLNLGVSKFRVMGIKDDSCPVCVDENERIYNISETGKLPPFHPGCRCVAIAEH